ncbi:MAG: NAD-dependent epimerase/dehydratase family protein [Bacteroidota bacterium]
MNVVITGASGMVGRGVLLECLDHPKIEKVFTVNRRSIEVTHPKHQELIVADFLNLKSIESELTGIDACYFCAGISSVGMEEAAYTQITYNLTMHFAKTLLEHNPDSVFIYVSGQGTDGTEQAKSFWRRVKGKTENDILKMGFGKAYAFRPGYIQPYRGIKSKTPWVNSVYAVLSPVYAVLKRFPSTATNTINIGKAMINATLERPDLPVFENKDINGWADRI